MQVATDYNIVIIYLRGSEISDLLVCKSFPVRLSASGF